MKKQVIWFLTMVLLAGGATSCTDMLQEETYGAASTDEFLNNPENFELMVGQTYANIKWLHDHWTYWGLCTLTADEAVCPVRQPSGHWADSDFWEKLNTHTWDAEGEAFNNVWYYCNSGAVLCNKVLDQLETYKNKFDDETYNRFKSELIVVRSFYYYTLFDCFGRIPYTENFSGEFVDLMEPEDVWKNLVRNLEEQAPHMPVASDGGWAYNYARATQGMAYTLLARLYLNAESYDVSAATVAEYDVYNKCIVACNKVIDSKEYKIEDEFFTNFAIKNEVSRENIFVIDEDGSANNMISAGNPMNKFRVSMLTMHYNHEQIWKAKVKPWNGFAASEEFIALYEEGDYRGLCDASEATGGTRVNGTKGAEGRRGWFVGPVYNEDNTAIAEDENKEKVILTTKLYGFDATYDFAFEATKPIKSTKAEEAEILKKQVEMLNEEFQTAYKYGDKIVDYFYPEGADKKDKEVKKKAQEDAEAAVKVYNETLNNKYRQERLYTQKADVKATTWNSGARCWKYEADKTGTYNYNENDFVFFRYADVLYMKAEAILRGGNGNLGDLLADADFQKIRTRVNQPAYASLDLNELYKERGREFAWECVRRRDMIRFGTFTTAQWGFVAGPQPETFKWFPIHRDVLGSEPRWVQNPGY